MKSRPTTIVGQGIAGTMLAFELERAGRDFRIVDAGLGDSASLIAAGIINPLAGRRFAPAWRVDELLPLAREAYGRCEQVLGVRVWRDMTVRRFLREPSERATAEQRWRDRSAAPYLASMDSEGIWIEGAAQVDLPTLLRAARARWLSAGRLEQRRWERTEKREGERVIHCVGAAARSLGLAPAESWQISKGELLTVAAPALAPGVILNRGTWVLPIGTGGARVGASYAPGVENCDPTTAVRDALLDDARSLVGGDLRLVSHDAGLRLTRADKRPVAEWMPGDPSEGLIAALGSKGVLWAPWLAQVLAHS